MNVFKAAALAVLTTLIFFFSTVCTPASADAPRYAYADRGSLAYLCSEKSKDSALFAIPQTYCVEILGEDGDWFRVKYADDSGAYRAVYGYCLKSDLIETPEPLENLYLNYTLKVIYRAESSSGQFPPLEIEMTAAYYGKFEYGGAQLSYVFCGDKFGYISETVDNFPLNDLPAPAFTETPQDNGNGTMLITAVVITVVAAAAVLILYFTSKKKPS